MTCQDSRIVPVRFEGGSLEGDLNGTDYAERTAVKVFRPLNPGHPTLHRQDVTWITLNPTARPDSGVSGRYPFITLEVCAMQEAGSKLPRGRTGRDVEFRPGT
jgi:hypothetical protein